LLDYVVLAQLLQPPQMHEQRPLHVRKLLQKPFKIEEAEISAITNLTAINLAQCYDMMHMLDSSSSLQADLFRELKATITQLNTAVLPPKLVTIPLSRTYVFSLQDAAIQRWTFLPNKEAFDDEFEKFAASFVGCTWKYHTPKKGDNRGRSSRVDTQEYW